MEQVLLFNQISFMIFYLLLILIFILNTCWDAWNWICHIVESILKPWHFTITNNINSSIFICLVFMNINSNSLNIWLVHIKHILWHIIILNTFTYQTWFDINKFMLSSPSHTLINHHPIKTKFIHYCIYLYKIGFQDSISITNKK
jgi:hypothetical protein